MPYFAEVRQRLVTIIADYRLYPHIKFPDPAVDIKDAFAFVVQHADEINADAPVQADVDNVYLLGHSAGAAIVSTMVLLPGFLSDDLRVRVRGLVLQGGAYHYRSGEPLTPAVASYYDTDEGRRNNEPLALLEQAPDHLIGALPPNIMMSKSENEPKTIATMTDDFRTTLSGRLGHQVPLQVMKGHVHVSPYFSLFCGGGDDWAHELSSWIKNESRSRL